MAEINVFCWRTAYRGIISDEYLFNKRSVLGTMENMGKRLNTPEFETDIFDDGIIKGFATHHPAGEKDIPRAYDLMAIYVEPPFKGLGIGSELIRSVEEKAQGKGFGTMIVWTLEKNDGAIRFYEKHGYARDGGKEHWDVWGAEIIRLRKEM